MDTSADDVAMLAFTSGTTGRPKATMHFHRDLLAIADTFSAKVLQPHPDDLFAGSPPLGFTFGLGALIVFPMRIGAATLLLEKGTPDFLLPAIERLPADHRLHGADGLPGDDPGAIQARRLVAATLRLGR